MLNRMRFMLALGVLASYGCTNPSQNGECVEKIVLFSCDHPQHRMVGTGGALLCECNREAGAK